MELSYGRAMPRASMAEAMVLAVYMPPAHGARQPGCLVRGHGGPRQGVHTHYLCKGLGVMGILDHGGVLNLCTQGGGGLHAQEKGVTTDVPIRLASAGGACAPAPGSQQ